MASSVAASLGMRTGLQLQCSFNQKPFFLGNSRSIKTNLFLPPHPFSPFSLLTFARRRPSRGQHPTDSPITSNKQKKKKKMSLDKGGEEEEDEDAFEALFRQLEEDLKNDDLSLEDGDDEEISEEELAKLEHELEEALKDDELLGAVDLVGDDDDEEEISEEELAKLERKLEEALKDDDLLGALDLVGDEKSEDESEDAEEEEANDNDDDYTANLDQQDIDDDDQETPVKLKNWQLKRLAYALKNGRRKTNIKNLAADLCLDRAVVLELLRDPPPDLLMMSAALPDKPVSTIVEPVNSLSETVPVEKTSIHAKPTAEVKMPVHVMQSNWSAKKRIKKAQLDTLERVYRRTKRPTNAMIGNIVHLTNLPRKRVVKWFEDKRAEDGVPEHHLPYQRSAPTRT